MIAKHNLIVQVRRQWNDWRIAEVNLSELDDVHWSTFSGGVGAPAPQPFIHGYISCDTIPEGELAHSCRHGSAPHRIKVCVVKKDNDKDLFAEIVRRAGPKPSRRK